MDEPTNRRTDEKKVQSFIFQYEPTKDEGRWTTKVGHNFGHRGFGHFILGQSRYWTFSYLDMKSWTFWSSSPACNPLFTSLFFIPFLFFLASFSSFFLAPFSSFFRNPFPSYKHAPSPLSSSCNPLFIFLPRLLSILPTRPLPSLLKSKRGRQAFLSRKIRWKILCIAKEEQNKKA